MKRHWFITGVSSGLGRALAQRLLRDGDLVSGTLRSPEQRAEFERSTGAQGVLLDVRDEAGIALAVAEAEKRAPIDVLVNNAGYGLEGAVEEVSLAEARAQFEVNVFGVLAVTQAVLPSMRARRAGHIVNIASVGGLTAFPGLGVYNASKFALEGMSEALAQELAPLGLRVTLVEPGAFRTDWAGRSMVHARKRIEAYATTAGAFAQSLATRNGNQKGDPERAADAIVQAVTSSSPPLHLVLGEDAFHAVRQKLDRLEADLRTWSKVTLGTSFDSQKST